VSSCADDAQDAYQRGLEILLRHADRLDSERAAGWLHTVVNHHNDTGLQRGSFAGRDTDDAQGRRRASRELSAGRRAPVAGSGSAESRDRDRIAGDAPDRPLVVELDRDR
jgi:hypothetical protein